MRLEVPFTAGDRAVLATYQHTGFDAWWYQTWSYRAAEAIPGVELARAITTEGDALFGSGGLVHVRLEGEAPPP